jgi:hypothetical protein
VETFLLLAGRLGFLPPEEREALEVTGQEIGRMLGGLKRSLRSRD